jgi:uncharacterized protein
MQIVRRSAFKAVPWKNRGGITHEAIRVPARGDPFRWRVSVAEVEASGPFSDFSGYDRNMVLLKGAGVELHFADGSMRALRAVGDLAEFDGALAARCELLGGACVDLNLIVAKELSGVRARVARPHDALMLPAEPGRILLAFAIDFTIELVTGGDREVLDPWDLAVLTGGQGVELRATGRAASVFLADLPA